MDTKNTIEWASRRQNSYNRLEANKYDYEADGIMQKCLPKILFKAAPVLVTFLQLIDMRLVLVFKYIKKMQHFKHISNF